MIFLQGSSQKQIDQFAGDSVTKLAIARIQYVYKVKQITGNSAWSTFGNERYNIPLVYYAGNATFVANPAVKFLKKFNPPKVFENKRIKIFKLDFRLDSTPFHMITSMSISGDTAAYDYLSPYIKCSSREEFESFTGYKTSTRQWTALVLHEFFHGFQHMHKGYTAQTLKEGTLNVAVGENLQKLYTYFDWFRNAIDTENDLLLRAIDSDQENETDSLIREFFKVREKRRSMTKTETNNDIDLLERSFENFEGTARFTEAYILEHPVNDKEMETIDGNFTVGGSHYSKAHEELFKTTTGRYYYATGYNMTRLLKKRKAGYEKVLFNQVTLTLEDLLKQSMH